MSKNKLAWTIALFLITIASLPIAHAQTFAGSRLFFILINSAIVFVILFVLQSFLIQPKDGKEKAGVWVAIVVASLLVGFLYGQNGFLWQGPLGVFFNLKVLVNAAIIAAVLYFVMGLTPVGKNLQSPQGKTGFVILIFLISAVFAVRLGNQWIWDLNNVILLRNYLFGAQGILVPPRLLVFITSFVLMAYFFVGYLSKNITGGPFVNYALVTVLAASMASAGVGLPTVIRIGELIFLIVLADALEGQKLDAEYKWGLAFLIVGWSSASLTAAFGPEYEGIIGSMLAPMLRYYGLIPTVAGEPVGFGSLLLSPIALVIVAILFAMKVVGGDKTWTKQIGSGGIIVYILLLLLSSWTSIGASKIGKL